MFNESDTLQKGTASLLIRRSRVRVPAGPPQNTAIRGVLPPSRSSTESTQTESLARDSVIAGAEAGCVDCGGLGYACICGGAP